MTEEQQRQLIKDLNKGKLAADEFIESAARMVNDLQDVKVKLTQQLNEIMWQLPAAQEKVSSPLPADS